ncbi:hypothetical protein HNY73_002041 [Argiope bruennichi]|uniref:Uncharacterized protein n=1 Tax=Argiope bruennichi TaxID=94029 RepID=A0A8T0FTB5_ARGBR|nr:hypothetical protein HNY73_002041 [Argiope bruennichi]
MDYTEYNLRQLLEFALRFPEIGAVNFNIIYLILKTIIKKQGIECLTPRFTFVYERPSDFTKENIISEKESESSDEIVEEKSENPSMVAMKKNIGKLKETIKQLSNRISQLEKRPTRKVKKVKKRKPGEVQDDADEKQEPIFEELEEPKVEQELEEHKVERELVEPKVEQVLVDPKVEPELVEPKVEPELIEPKVEPELIKPKEERELETKVYDEEDVEELPAESEDVEKMSKTAFDRLFKQKIQEIKKQVVSSQGTDQDEIWTEMKAVQATNEFVVEKCDELLQDFDTVMIKIEDDLEKLREQVERLELYVYSGKHAPEEEKEKRRLQEAVPLTEEGEASQFMKGEVEKVQQTKVDRKTHFARMVKNLMTMPEEKRAEIVKGPIQPEVKRVKPTTMKKAYEKFIKATQGTRAGIEETRLKDEEKAEKVAISQPQETSELVVTEEAGPPSRGTAKKLHRTAQAIVLLQNMQRTQQAGRLVRAKEMEAYRALQDSEDEEDEEQLSVERLEIETPPSKQLSIEQLEESTPAKATLLYGGDKATQHLKERIVMYIKSRLEELETRFWDKMHTEETSIIEIQGESEVFKEEMRVLKNRIAVAETNQYKFEGRLTTVEEKANLNDLHIEEMMIALDKKADRSDTVQGMTKKDMSILEDRMLKINETTLLDIEELTLIMTLWPILSLMRLDFIDKLLLLEEKPEHQAM